MSKPVHVNKHNVEYAKENRAKIYKSKVPIAYARMSKYRRMVYMHTLTLYDFVQQENC